MTKKRELTLSFPLVFPILSTTLYPTAEIVTFNMSSSIVTEMQRTFMHLRVPMDPLPPAGQLVAGPQQCTCYRCKPNLYRTHRPNPGTFKIGQHDYYALATHAVAWFTVPVVIEPRDVPSGLYEPRVLQAGQQVQLGARDVWRRLQQEFRFLRDYLTSGALTKFIAEKIVPYAMGIFDMVFFLGAFCPRNDRRNPAHRLQLRVLAVESTIKSRIQPVRFSSDYCGLQPHTLQLLRRRAWK